MPNLYGSTTTSATGTAYDIAYKLKSFTVVNRSGGGITINVSILYGSTNTLITPVNKALAADEMYSDTIERVIPADAQIYLLTSGACDYFFSIEDGGEDASA